MRIFLSYASEDRERIEPIRFALAEQGHDIFYDREDLKPGESYDSRIRSAIERTNLFICFLTPHTVDAGSYTLSELAVAERMWPNADGRVLPVMLDQVPRKDIPAYLRSVTWLEPVGNVTASVSDAVMLLDLRNTNALMFRNSGTGAFNMVYRRGDGTIGWVEPERS